MSGTLKISMGGMPWELIRSEHSPVAEHPILDTAAERKQGTGTAYVLPAVPVDDALELAEAFGAIAEHFQAHGERGTGDYERRKAAAKMASKIRSELIERGAISGPIKAQGMLMKAKGIGSLEDFKFERRVIEPKLDGWRAHAFVHSADRVEIWIGGGRENAACKLPHIVEALAKTMPAGTFLDGEAVMLATGERPDNWGGVQRVLGSNADRPLPEREEVRFLAFDIVQHAGEDVRSKPFEQRRALLERLPVDGDVVQLVPQLPPEEDSVTACLSLGYEGVVVKSLDHPYQSGKRPSHQGKIKAQSTADVEVTGFSEGGGAFEGYIGAICFDGELEDGTRVSGQCSGMDWKTRVHMTENPEEWIGTIIEVKYWGVVGTALRHPQYKRRRPDKA